MTDDRHRVFFPGPHADPATTQIIDHADGCDPETCPVAAALTTWLARPDLYIAVEGEYFTTDGASYERCAWQSGIRR